MSLGGANMEAVMRGRLAEDEDKKQTLAAASAAD